MDFDSGSPMSYNHGVENKGPKPSKRLSFCNALEFCVCLFDNLLYSDTCRCEQAKKKWNDQLILVVRALLPFMLLVDLNVDARMFMLYTSYLEITYWYIVN